MVRASIQTRHQLDPGLLSDSDTVNITVNAVKRRDRLPLGGATLARRSTRTRSGTDRATVIRCLAASLGLRPIRSAAVSRRHFAGLRSACYTVDATKGNWQYSTNTGGSWTNLITVRRPTTAIHDGHSRGVDHRCVFVAGANYNGFGHLR